MRSPLHWSAERPSRAAASVTPRFKPSIGSRPRAHDDNVPQPVIGLAARHVGELAAAKGRDEPGLGERGLAGAAVRDDGDQPVLLELVDEHGDLLVAAEEPIRIRFRHRLESDEGIFERDSFFAGRSAEHGAQQLGELLGIVERVADPLVLPRKRRQRGGARAFPGENRDEGIIRQRRSRGKREPNLASTQFTTPLAPICTAKAVAFSLIAFSIWACQPSRRQVVLSSHTVSPAPPRVRTFEEAAFQFTRSIGVGARMAEEKTGSGTRSPIEPASSQDIGHFQASEARPIQHPHAAACLTDSNEFQ